MSRFPWIARPSAKATRLLGDYADETFLWAAAPGALTPDQRRANLDAFTASLPRRLARVQAFAEALGTTLPIPDGNRAAVDLVGRTLDHFCKSALSGLTVLESALAMDWRARAPQGLERHAQTLTIDLGAYCGEVGIRCATKYAWVTDETRYKPDDLMRTAGRVVIGHDPVTCGTSMRNHVDAIDIAAFALAEIVRHRKNPGVWRPNYFHFLGDLADGRHA